MNNELFFKKEWKDEYLQWDPKDYEGIDKIRFPIDAMWKPDLFLYNAGDSDSWNPYGVSSIIVILS